MTDDIKRGRGRPPKHKNYEKAIAGQKEKKSRELYANAQTIREEITRAQEIYESKTAKPSPKREGYKERIQIEYIGKQKALEAYQVIVDHAIHEKDLDACKFIVSRVVSGEIKGQYFPFTLSVSKDVTLENVRDSMKEVFILLGNGEMVDTQAAIIFKLLEGTLGVIKAFDDTRLADLENKYKQLIALLQDRIDTKGFI